MNNTAKTLIGAAIGGAIGYFIGGVIVEMIHIKQNPVEIDNFDGPEEYEEPKAVFNHKKNEKPIGRVTRRDYSDIFKKNPELGALVAKYNTGTNPQLDPEINADILADEDEFTKEEEVNDFEREHLSEDDLPIAIISLNEFINNDMGYEEITLSYYDDDVVTDEHDNPIDRPEQILGDEALVSFGQMSEDEDVVYVRNVPKKAIYEVVRLNKNYGVQLEKNRRLEAKKALRRDRIDGMGAKEADNGEETKHP